MKKLIEVDSLIKQELSIGVWRYITVKVSKDELKAYIKYLGDKLNEMKDNEE